MKNSKTYKFLFLIVFALLVCIPIFSNLGHLGIHAWDESLFAIRAYYFTEFGEAIKNFNQLGLANYNNSKPVFMTIVQSVFIKIFGYSELSLRLPIAISFFITILFLIYISKQIFKNYAIGFLAAFVLVSSPGMYVEHMARFGDQDIAFALFSLAMLYHIFLFLEYKKTIHLVGFSFFLCIGFYTKSVAIFIPLAGVFIYFFSCKKNYALLKDKRVLLAFFLVILVLAFSLLEKVNHLSNVTRLYSDFKQEGPFYYYFRYLFKKGHFLPWLIILPFSIKYFKKQKFIQFLIIVSATFFLILSVAQTKLSWYAAALYPLFSILVAYVLFHAFLYYKNRQEKYNKTSRIIVWFLVVILFVTPYLFSLNLVFRPKILNKNNYYGNILKLAKTNYPSKRNIIFLKDYNDGYLPQVEYYNMLYNTKFGYSIVRKIYHEECKQNEIVICNDYYAIQNLSERFQLDTLESFKENYLLKLN